MESVARPDLPIAPALAAMLASGAGLYFATGLEPVAALTWIAAWPVLVAAHRSGGWRGFALAFGAWCIGGAGLASYLHGTLSIPLPIVALALAIPALQFGLVVALSRALAARGRPLAAAIALPAAWVALDYLQSLGSPHGTFGNLAYTQLDLLPVVQMASLTGVWGLDFLLMLVPSALAVLAAYRLPRRTRLSLAIGTAAPFVFMLAFGAWRLSQPAAPTLRVALVVADEPAFPHPLGDAASQRMLASASDAIAKAAARHPRILVLPETIVAIDPSSYLAFASRLQGLSRDADAMIVVGADLKDRDGERNTALVFQPAGAPVERYAKQHLLPPFERRYRAGTALLAGRVANAAWGVAICKDMDFPALPRAYAHAGVGMMLVPAWDFVRDGRLHARMAVMRGIEGGFAVARSARTGRMTVSDAYGRIVAERTSAADATFLVADVPASPVRTLYARFGDWFARIALALSAGCMLILLATRRRIDR